MLWRFVRPCNAGRDPHDKHIFVIDCLDRYFREICRAYQIVEADNIFLDNVKFRFIDSFNRTDSYTILVLFDANKNITSAEIVKIIGESTNTMVDVVWVPSGLKFDAVRFNMSLIKKLSMLISNFMFPSDNNVLFH